jgi:GGDEF domain-containing protein
LERIESLDDTDLIEVLYGDFVRKVFQGYRVTVTPGRPTPGATPLPQLAELEEGDGRYGRVRLYDDLVVVSGPPGSLREEHLEWLTRLRQGTQARLDRLQSTLDIDPLTSLGSERKFHGFVSTLARKQRWVGWLMCLTMVPEEGANPTLEDVEGILRQVADFLRQHHPAAAQLFRMNNGFFAALVPGLSADETESLLTAIRDGLAKLPLRGVASLKSVVGTAPFGTGKRESIVFYQQLMESLQRSSGGQLTLSDLRRTRPRAGADDSGGAAATKPGRAPRGGGARGLAPKRSGEDE